MENRWSWALGLVAVALLAGGCVPENTSSSSTSPLPAGDKRGNSQGKVKDRNTLRWLGGAGGSQHTLVALSNGHMYAWGANGAGQMGTTSSDVCRDKPCSFSPRLVNATLWAQVAGGKDHTLAVAKDGSLWAWGGNRHGQLGDGTRTRRTEPVRVGTANDWANVAAGENVSLAMTADGSLFSWGKHQALAPQPLAAGEHFRFIAAGDHQLLAIREDGRMFVWGEGCDEDDHGCVAREVGQGGWSMAAVGDKHSVGVKTDGTLWVWKNEGHEHGHDGDHNRNHGPSALAAQQIGFETGWVMAAAGRGHFLAVKADHSLWAWGSNQAGQLGDGTTQFRALPVQIMAGTSFSMVGAGGRHSGAVTTNGLLFTWGENTFGQLGTAELTPCPATADQDDDDHHGGSFCALTPVEIPLPSGN
ncbi:MAG: hypothetical protein OEV94_10310 [Deltaproteobacteria bacterium]|nr:hypothetical protein [Deltaproteobacteria bacterium]